MSAGSFDKRVVIEGATAGAENAYGEAGEETWAEVGQRYASIQESGGGEFFRARQVDAEVTAVITLRKKLAGLTERHRIRYGDRVFNIRTVLGQDDRTPGRGQIVHATEAKGA